ncbi:RNA polymerase sigma-70 factor [Mucilaginibacter gynuensis]|uniref:RNA polymerase sigma-70 factor n=1 Tax=Mucilaginibacter gynuensis TaxID=1302236 RepID=A0ABP8G5I0_9SPHI
MRKASQDLPDKILMEMHLEGDAKAFEILFKRYYDSLLRYALRNTKELETAEELTMDVMLRIWQKQTTVTLETDLRPYLQRAIKNAIFNYHRKKILDIVTIEEDKLEAITNGNNADDKIRHTELKMLYQQKLGELSPQRQKVFRMSREDNMSYAQIAKQLGLSVNTVENYMVASLQFFREHMKEHTDYIAVLVILLSL